MASEEFVDYSLELESNDVPIAVVLPTEQEVVVGAIVKLDGRSSIDPNGAGLTYQWSFSQVPIGSQVETFGFTNFEDDSSIVGFAPDITGTYKVRLIVNDGSLDSDPAEALVDVRVILVPNHQGYVPDASFIWNYLSDFWTQVADRKRFETFWSGAIQVAASEMLKIYQYQYNKSIRDIQELIQKRWISFSPGLELDRSTTSFILADDTAGSQATTFVINSDSGIPETAQPNYTNVITIPTSEGDFTETEFRTAVATGRLIQLGDRSYTLIRANDVFQSINYGIDGATSGSVTFQGTQFTPEMVGATLRILSKTSTLIGDYEIATYVSPTQITVDAIHPGTTWPGQSDLVYTVLPANAQNSSFFADQQQVPAGLDQQPWRLSATLVSSEVDFEAQGVCPGDVVEVEVTRIGLQVLSNFFIQIVSVDRNRAGFVMNLEDLVEGQAAQGLTEDIQVTLAADLIVPGLSSNPDGSLSYNLEAGQVNQTVRSISFKRTYFEKELTSDDEINVGPFSIVVRPVRIIRNRKMAIDEAFVSVPILQEYVKQPDVIEENGAISFVMNGVKTSMSRLPYLLSENLDYIIDDESTITGSALVVAGDDTAAIAHGDPLDRMVNEGDEIEILIGNVKQTFTIRRVLTADSIRVFPTPTVGTTAGLFTLTRRIPGKFLRFISGTFNKKSPAPTRLWSEISFLDNGEAIEGNFGILVGVRREDLEKVGSGIPYKSAVAGLMYALTNGPTISNLTLSAQILLGLPFAQNAGVITEINPAFRKRDDGSPLFGRVLVEGRDRFNNKTGVTNIYFYPEGRQIFDVGLGKWLAAVPEFSGLAINPDTGVEYAVGDAVTQFAPLSKGVKIEEYLTNPNWVDLLVAQGNVASTIQKYHAFEVVVNSDLITSVDVDLMAQFMFRVKAHYVRLISTLLKSLEDVVEIDDVLSFGRTQYFFDNSDLGTPTAATTDSLDENEAYLSLDGNLYTRLHYGDDLSTTYNTEVVTTADGGLVDPRVARVESWVPPKVRPGDQLTIIEGSNVGSYVIDSVDSDGQVTLGGNPTFETKTGQKFFIHRPLKNPIFMGKVIVDQGNAVVQVREDNNDPGSIDTSGVSVGDLLIFKATTLNAVPSRRYVITEVTPDDTNPTIRVTPVIAEVDGTYEGWVIREGVMTKTFPVPHTIAPTFRINATTGQNYINFVDSGLAINTIGIALIRPGSVFRLDGIPYTVLKWDRVNRRALVTPPLLATFTGHLLELEGEVELRPEMASEPISVDFLDRMPGDALSLEIQASLTTGDDANTTATSTDITLTVATPSTIGARPGDYFILLEGADSLVDVGFGAGVFPIHQIVGGTTIRLADQLSATGTFRYGLRRKVPNEG